MMEKAIFITKVSQLKYVNDKYDRLYFGNEFCERLIPRPGYLKQILSHARKKDLKFSLVTPYVTDYGLAKLAALFDLLRVKNIECEAIVNDWGVLHLINRKYPNLTPILGRLLTKQKRCPRLAKLLKRNAHAPWFIKDRQDPRAKYMIFQKKLPKGLDPYYKGSNTSSVPIIHNFLLNQRIRRIELDNVAQGLFLELPNNKISASVYFPYVYITTTFFCPTARCDQNNKTLFRIKPCSRPCQRYIFRLRHRAMPKTLLLKGNTKFYRNPKLPIHEFAKIGVDRIVYEPEIPV